MILGCSNGSSLHRTAPSKGAICTRELRSSLTTSAGVLSVFQPAVAARTVNGSARRTFSDTLSRASHGTFQTDLRIYKPPDLSDIIRKFCPALVFHPKVRVLVFSAAVLSCDIEDIFAGMQRTKLE